MTAPRNPHQLLPIKTTGRVVPNQGPHRPSAAVCGGARGEDHQVRPPSPQKATWQSRSTQNAESARACALGQSTGPPSGHPGPGSTPHSPQRQLCRAGHTQAGPRPPRVAHTPQPQQNSFWPMRGQSDPPRCAHLSADQGKRIGDSKLSMSQMCLPPKTRGNTSK